MSKPKPLATPLEISSVGRAGSWETRDGEYRQRAKRLLGELKVICDKIEAMWPSHLGHELMDQTKHPELWAACELRDTVSDSTRISAAMSVEGFLNFYGVYRLGQQVFDEHYERLGLVPKLRGLVLICEQTNIDKRHPAVVNLERIAQSRNDLVHPKAREVGPAPPKNPLPIPGEAQSAVQAMEEFYQAFAELGDLPNALAQHR